jgi:ComF family protein
VDYAYPWDQVLVDFKFHAHVGLARALARLMRAAPWIEAELEAADMLVPMPLSTQRLSERGFNQSLVLARALEHAHIASDVLVRVRDTPPQSSLSRTERTSNVHGAYLPNPAKAQSIRDQRIVILDDVMTTGASMRAAAQALRQAGARSVSGLIFARTA